VIIGHKRGWSGRFQNSQNAAARTRNRFKNDSKPPSRQERQEKFPATDGHRFSQMFYLSFIWVHLWLKKLARWAVKISVTIRASRD